MCVCLNCMKPIQPTFFPVWLQGRRPESITRTPSPSWIPYNGNIGPYRPDHPKEISRPARAWPRFCEMSKEFCWLTISRVKQRSQLTYEALTRTLRNDTKKKRRGMLSIDSFPSHDNTPVNKDSTLQVTVGTCDVEQLSHPPYSLHLTRWLLSILRLEVHMHGLIVGSRRLATSR